MNDLEQQLINAKREISILRTQLKLASEYKKRYEQIVSDYDKLSKCQNDNALVYNEIVELRHQSIALKRLKKGQDVDLSNAHLL